MALLKKNIRLPVSLILLSLLFGISTAGAREEKMTIDNHDAYTEKHRAAVTFPHELHVGDLECLTCHHDYKEGKNILDDKKLTEDNPDIRCAACHDDNADIGLQRAYHSQCMGCHRQFRIHRYCLTCGKRVWLAGSGLGPELCGECHVKK
jgi:hypothetical protein